MRNPPVVLGWMREIVEETCREYAGDADAHRIAAAQLRARGASYSEIAAALGYRAHSSASRLLNGRPSQRKGLRP